MEKQSDDLTIVAELSDALASKGFTPTLVGGMALVIMGSRRVTWDFDFVISLQNTIVDDMVEIFYKKGFELVSKLDGKNNIVRTIDNKNIATARLKIDAPTSAFFYNPKTKLKIDLMFDFPFPAHQIASRADPITIESHVIRVASRDDLLKLKEIAYKDRGLSTDAQDIEFLKSQK